MLQGPPPEALRRRSLCVMWLRWLFDGCGGYCGGYLAALKMVMQEGLLWRLFWRLFWWLSGGHWRLFGIGIMHNILTIPVPRYNCFLPGQLGNAVLCFSSGWPGAVL
jgi:hypothetical protein